MITLHFWQMAVARITALIIGIVVGTYWHEHFANHLIWLAAVGIIGSLYILYVVFGGRKG